MGKVIIVSNRVTLPDNTNEAGGLAVAIQEALHAKGGTWLGWSGHVREYPKTNHVIHSGIDYVTLDLTRNEHTNFYLGFSNAMLWPLFHYRMGQTRYSKEMYEGYDSVNEKFADAVARQTCNDDTIWVHDYHLLRLATHLRAKHITNRTGFFLHIPFPVPEMVEALPMHSELLTSMCDYDLLGFQTREDLKAFQRSVTKFCGARKLSNIHGIITLQVGERRIQAGCFPISIDTEAMIKAAEVSENTVCTRQLKTSLLGRRMIIGVDRMDYTKGIPARLKAYNQLLQDQPSFKGNISYIQITPPSRTDVEEYRELRKEVESLAAHINGVHANIDWVPLRYVTKSFSRNELAGFYRMAKAGLVTPLRDGMNLVAKEYVASQNPLDPGVLILSKFAGAANELKGALLVNPYDEEEIADAMQQALTMPLAARKRRYNTMIAVLRANTIFDWSRNFLQILETPEPKAKALPGFATSIEPHSIQVMPTPTSAVM